MAKKNKEIETASYDKEKFVETRGMQYPKCRFCGSPVKDPGLTRCEQCSNDLTAGENGDSGGSRLTDEELSVKLKGLSAIYKFINILFLPGFIIMFILFVAELPQYAFPLLLLLVVLIFASMNVSRKLSLILCFNIVQDTITEAFTDCIYKPGMSIAPEFIRSTNLIHGWDQFKGYEFFTGGYKGHVISFSEIRLSDSGSNNDSGSTTLFEGQWLTCKLGRQLPAMVRVCERSNSKLQGDSHRDKSDVETENPVFNEKFRILTDDPHTALYVLTPHFMEYILSADRRAKGRTYLCFSGDRVHIAIHNNRRLFDIMPKSSETRNIPTLRARMKSEIKYLTDILDELFKNKYLFQDKE